MPLVHREETEGQTHVYAWKVTEDLSWFSRHLPLSQSDVEDLHAMHPRRALEWSASRFLLRQYTHVPVPFKCLNDRFGRPYIPGEERQVSISHSHGMVAVALSMHNVGVDVQVRSDKIWRIADKFVGEAEIRTLQESGQDHRLLHLCWSSKEALFKAYYRGQLDFRRHIFVDLPRHTSETGTLTGAVKKKGVHMRCKIHYRFISDYILVHATEIL